MAISKRAAQPTLPDANSNRAKRERLNILIPVVESVSAMPPKRWRSQLASLDNKPPTQDPPRRRPPLAYRVQLTRSQPRSMRRTMESRATTGPISSAAKMTTYSPKASPTPAPIAFATPGPRRLWTKRTRGSLRWNSVTTGMSSSPGES